ncbi:hypothetical protein BB561_000718 [Smittium simulii]|uniref:PSP proline-rich domain-containing protein n=1 Tax=Smittium simulii TaxID=133385 RepID=A0A2T9YXW6_9FUNG|nr:hypothetical protein BB561_000718 [Smittium simulii]
MISFIAHIISVIDQMGSIESSLLKNSKTKPKSNRKRRNVKKPHTKPIFKNGLAKPQLSKNVEIEYVAEAIDFSENPDFAQFQDIFNKFEQKAQGLRDDLQSTTEGQVPDQENIDADVLSDSHLSELDNAANLSKSKLKKLQRISVAELKQVIDNPEVVEWEDVTARDPIFLAYLKGVRNSVPIPRHWSQKRKYLQYKRGVEKPPFELPAFIRDTGISAMRESIKDKEDSLKSKTKQRERVQPKMNKLVIDYQRLHDAFFRFQTLPENLSGFGEVFYEGKEFETKKMDFQPGLLSDEIKEALGIPPLAPPPWLINMQRFGPPPSYPDMLIPGLSSPIPPGAQWGYHPGGWGRPPVDSFGRPLYGDVLGVIDDGTIDEFDNNQDLDMDTVPIKFWGSYVSDEESEDESEADGESDDSGPEGDSFQTNQELTDDSPNTGSTTIPETAANIADISDGLVTPSGMMSVPSGMDTPDVIQLKKSMVYSEQQPGPKQLYTVLPQKQVGLGAQNIMGSQHIYDLSSATGETVGNKPSNTSNSKKRSLQNANNPNSIAVSLDPQELANLDEQALQEKYESQIAARNSESSNSASKAEDLSDMVAEHAQHQARKRQRQKPTEYKF